MLIVDLGEKFGKGLSSPIGGPREELEGPKFSQAHFFSSPFPLLVHYVCLVQDCLQRRQHDHHLQKVKEELKA